MIQCLLCAKTFKSRSGLRRHSNSRHPFDPPIVDDKAPPHEETVTDDQDARAKSDDDDAMIQACRALGIKPENVVDFKVYPHKVAIIEAPKNWKKTWYREA